MSFQNLSEDCFLIQAQQLNLKEDRELSYQLFDLLQGCRGCENHQKLTPGDFSG